MDQMWILFDRECKYSTAPRIVSKTTKKHSNLETFMKSHAFDNITKMSYSKNKTRVTLQIVSFGTTRLTFIEFINERYTGMHKHAIHYWNTQLLGVPYRTVLFVKCQQLSDKSESYRYMVTDYFLRNLPAHPFYDFSNIGLVRLPTEPPQIGCMCIFRESLSATDGVR